jgi:hypothetical protein
MLRFEEALEGWHSGRLSQGEAALLLEVCERMFRRQIARYEVAKSESAMLLLLMRSGSDGQFVARAFQQQCEMRAIAFPMYHWMYRF